MTVSMTVPQYWRRECTIDGVRHFLQPKEALVLAILLAADPDQFVPFEDLVEKLWPDPDLQPLCAAKSVAVRVQWLRGLGIPVLHRRGHYNRTESSFVGWCIPRHARAGEQQLQAAA